MKNLKTQIKNMCPASKLILKAGTLFATLLLLLAFFSFDYGIMMCSVSVYLFSESVVAGLLFDVISKRMNK